MTSMNVFYRFLIALCLLALPSCIRQHDLVEVSYELELSARQVAELKADLSEFASQNQHIFLDGSAETKKARDYINREFETSSGKGANLVGQGFEIIDVTVETANPELDFLIFAKTSAYDAERVSLTVIYNRKSATEKAMADIFFGSGIVLSISR